jgi:hypothetical protein
MEEEEGGGRHLPFLDIGICRKTEGSPYCIGSPPIPVSTFPPPIPPSQKTQCCGFSLFVIKDSLTQELEFFTTVFSDNGYSPQQI